MALSEPKVKANGSLGTSRNSVELTLRGKIMSNWLVAVFFCVSAVISIGCSTAAAADGLQPAVSVYTMSPGRLGAIAAGLVGLTGIVLGALALRSAGRSGTNSGRSGAIVAIVAGLIGMALGGLVVV